MTQQQQPSKARGAGGASASVAFHKKQARAESAIAVTSAQIEAGASIPARHTAYGDGIAPALRWTPFTGALSYVLLVEDPDAPTSQPFVHWLAWNIPADVHELREGMPQTATADDIKGMRQGANDRGEAGYFGPRPPQGDEPHHYHFQVFALDCMLDLPSAANRDDVVAAMDGHVLAKGQLVATSKAPVAR